MYVLRKEISLTTIWNFIYKAPVKGVFLQVHYSYLWSSFAAKNIYQEHERKDAFVEYKKKNFKKAKNGHFFKGVEASDSDSGA